MSKKPAKKTKKMAVSSESGATSSDHGVKYVAPAIMDLSTSADIKEKLLALLDARGDVTLTIDLGKVEKLTTPGVQLLLATQLLLQSNGGNLQLSRPTQAAQQSMQLLGVEPLFAVTTS